MTDLEQRPDELTRPASTGRLGPVLERYPAREVPLGGIRAAVVRRTLPHRELPTVGAWCFLDAFTPGDPPMNVLPHPHIGLQTVTWPLAGQMLHRDSLGSVQVLRHGELNVMTSGDGIAHSEWMLDDAGAAGLQLWVALPEHARHVPAAFEHVTDLPVVHHPGATVTVFVGEHDGAASPAHVHSPLVGLEVDLAPGTELALQVRPDFEHAALVTRGEVTVESEVLTEAGGDLLHLGTDRSVITLLAGPEGGRLTVLGGEPLAEDLVMWWNFVGRSHEDVAQAREDWEDPARRPARFGVVEGHAGALIPAPPLPNVRLTPRRRRAPGGGPHRAG